MEGLIASGSNSGIHGYMWFGVGLNGKECRASWSCGGELSHGWLGKDAINIISQGANKQCFSHIIKGGECFAKVRGLHFRNKTSMQPSKRQGWRIPCNSEGAQALGMRTISYLGGSGGMLPQENLEFLTSRECFWGLLTVVWGFF